MTIIFVWLLLAALGFFLSAPFFRSLPDKGLGFAPWVGLFSISFPLWWLGHSGLTQLSTFSTWTVFFLIIAAIGWQIRSGKIKIADYKFNPIYLVYHIAIWIGFYSLYTWFYKHNPGISDIEKLPDLSMLVSSYMANELPPQNTFAAGQVINYYYYNFYQTAALAHFASIEAWQIFNPMKAIVFATASTSLASAAILVLDRLIRKGTERFKIFINLLGGTFSFVFAYLIGNFHTMYHHVILNEEGFWYPKPTRFIENTIHEFPLYSFFIGDLHAHLLALPTTGITLALIFLYAEKLTSLPNNLKEILKGSWKYLVPLCMAYGYSYASNSWDIFTGLLLVGFLTWFILKESSLFSVNTLLNTGALSLIYMGLAFVAFAPFWILFEPISSGLGHTPSSLSSPTLQLFVIWVVHASFPLLYLCLEKKKEFVYSFLRTVCAVGFGLIVFMEFFYFKDIYSGHLRANTLFKIGLQVWIWFSLASACYFAYIFSSTYKFKKHIRYGLIVLFAVLLASGLLYTKMGTEQYLSIHKASHSQDTGIDYLKLSYPDYYNIINWLKQNEDKQVVVLTRNVSSFDKHAGGSITAFTGMPSVLTWQTHNWLWHGSSDKTMKPTSAVQKRSKMDDTVDRRSHDVQMLYTSKNESTMRGLVDKYKIKYIVVGPREREQYKKINEELFNTVGKLVFKTGQTSLYQVSEYEGW